MAPPLSVIKIIKYCGKHILLINNIIKLLLYIACHQLALVSYKEFSVSLRSVHGNIEKHVLFEKLTATGVLNFTRCHVLKPINNCHVIIIHIQYTIAFGLILTCTRIKLFRYIACTLYNSFSYSC